MHAAAGSARSYHGRPPKYKSISRRFGRGRFSGMMEAMRRIAVALVAVALLPAAASAHATPRVSLVDRSPATVRGTAFAPAEHVAVTLSVGDVTLRKTVVATAQGVFVARWRRSVPTGCVAIGIAAWGSAGSRAVYRLSPPECAPLQP